LKKTWRMAHFDAQFLARMEALLALYAVPHEAQEPVICYDERPCYLIGEAVAALPMTTGQVAKEHYAYSYCVNCPGWDHLTANKTVATGSELYDKLFHGKFLFQTKCGAVCIRLDTVVFPRANLNALRPGQARVSELFLLLAPGLHSSTMIQPV
jgi:hypothetical protein